MKQLILAGSLLALLSLVAGFSLLSDESAMLRVLTRVESDARQRELKGQLPGNPTQWKHITPDGQRFVFAVPLPTTSTR